MTSPASVTGAALTTQDPGKVLILTHEMALKRQLVTCSESNVPASNTSFSSSSAASSVRRREVTLSTIIKSIPQHDRHRTLQYELAIFHYVARKWRTQASETSSNTSVANANQTEAAVAGPISWVDIQAGRSPFIADRIIPNGVFGPFALLFDPHESKKGRSEGVTPMLRWRNELSDRIHKSSADDAMSDTSEGVAIDTDSESEMGLELLLPQPTASATRDIRRSTTRRALSRAPLTDAQDVSSTLVYPDIGGEMLSTHMTLWSTACQVAGGERQICIPPMSTLIDILQCALSVTDQIRRLHELGVVLKSIRPQVIVYNSITRASQLLDYSLASLLDRESSGWSRSGILDVPAANWHWMSPEQTGRVPRLVDSRTDLYSLGMTFYALLAGSPAFPFVDPLDVIQGHLAGEVRFVNVEPAERTDGSTLAHARHGWDIFQRVILKLLNKSVDQGVTGRYQSAQGLFRDLEYVLHVCTGVVEMNASFEIGRTDLEGTFVVSQKLYGREAEVQTLLSAYQQLLPPYQRGPQLVLVGGFSGIGKTALIDYVHKPLVLARGRFCKAKFDLYRRNTAVIFEAFHSLITQTLADEDVDQWKAAIVKAIGGMSHAQLLIDAIPALELLIGRAPPLGPLPPAEASATFNRLFISLTSAFATPDHPLVIFVDDSQWADTMSLSLIALLVRQSHLTLMLISAYRSNEVNPHHPLLTMIREVKEYEQQESMISSSSDVKANPRPPAPPSRITTILLDLLGVSYCTELVADTLRCTPARARPLAEVLHRQTVGSPFFFHLLLRTYHSYGWIQFNWEQCEWEWNLTAVRMDKIGSLDSVVALLQAQVSLLPPAQQHLLSSAACIGNRFSLETISVATEMTQQQVARVVWPLILSGLLVPLGSAADVFTLADADPKDLIPDGSPSSNSSLVLTHQPILFRFLHDSVQQASYQLLPVTVRPNRHLAIARLLYQHAVKCDLLDQSATDIVEQFNVALDLIVEADELKQVIHLQQLSAAKAKASTTFERCNHYFKVAKQLLQRLMEISHFTLPSSVDTPNAQPFDRDLVLLYLSVGRGLTDSYYLIGDSTSAEFTGLELLEFAEPAVKCDPTLLSEHVAALELLITVYAAQNSRIGDCIEMTHRCLALLKVPLLDPNSPEGRLVMARDMRDLVDAPDAFNEQNLLVMRLLNSILAVAWISGRFELLHRVICTMMAQAYEFGGSIYGACALIFLAGSMRPGDYSNLEHEYRIQAERTRASVVGKQLLDRFAHSRLTSGELRGITVVAFFAVCATWFQPFSVSVAGLRAAFTDCIESAQYEYAAYSVALGGCYRIHSGQPLLSLETYLQDHLVSATRARRAQEVAMTQYCLPFVQKLLLKRTHNEPFTLLSGQETNETKMAQELFDSSVHLWSHTIFNYIQQYFFYRQEYDKVVELTPMMKILRVAIAGHPVISIDYMINGIALMRNIRISPELITATQKRVNEFACSFDDTSSPHEPEMKAAISSNDSLAQFHAIRADIQWAIKLYMVWASQSPLNFAHRPLLLEAEWMRLQYFLEGRRELGVVISARLRQAFELARIARITQDVGLAAELLARWYLHISAPLEAWTYLCLSWDAYMEWQCPLKLQQMAIEFRQIDSLRTIPGAMQHEIFGSTAVENPRALIEPHIADQSFQTTPTTLPLSTTVAASSLSPHVSLQSSDGFAPLDLDLETVFRFISSSSVEVDPTVVRHQTMELMLKTAGASRGVLILEDLDRKDCWNVELAATVAPMQNAFNNREGGGATSPSISSPSHFSSTLHQAEISQRDDTMDLSTSHSPAPGIGSASSFFTSPPLPTSKMTLSFELPSDRSDISSVMPLRVFQFVLQSHEPCLLTDASKLPPESSLSALGRDPYFARHQPRSLLACPVLKHRRVIGVLYLENDFNERAFNTAHIHLLHLLCSQSALSIDNNRLFVRLRSSLTRLEDQVRERTGELMQRNEQLETEIQVRQQAEQEMRLAKDLAIQAGNAKSDFLATMSHELRTPLNAILGLSRLLLSTELTEEQENYLVLLSNSSHLLLTIVNDVLDYSKIEAGKVELERQSVNFLDVIETAVMLCADPASNKRLDLTYWADPIVCTTYEVDVTRIQQILLNLLSNAIKFTSSDGSIRLNVTATPFDTSQSIAHADYLTSRSSSLVQSTKLDADTEMQVDDVVSHLPRMSSDSREYMIQIEVHDNGIGIDENDQLNLFQSFRQARKVHTTYGGTGLGLAISRRLAEAMGGTVWCRSKVGEGSVFSVSLRAKEVVTPQQMQMMNNPVHFPLSAPGELTQVMTVAEELRKQAQQEESGFASMNLHLRNPYGLGDEDIGLLGKSRVLLVGQHMKNSMDVYLRLLSIYKCHVVHLTDIQVAKQQCQVNSDNGNPYDLLVLEENEILRLFGQDGESSATTAQSSDPTESIGQSRITGLREIQRSFIEAGCSRILWFTDRRYISYKTSHALTGSTLNTKVVSSDAQVDLNSLPPPLSLENVPTRKSEVMQLPEISIDSPPPPPSLNIFTNANMSQSTSVPTPRTTSIQSLIGYLPKPFKHSVFLEAVLKELRLVGHLPAGPDTSSNMTNETTIQASMSPYDDRVRQMLLRTATKTSASHYSTFAPSGRTISTGDPSESVSSNWAEHSQFLPLSHDQSGINLPDRIAQSATSSSTVAQSSRDSLSHQPTAERTRMAYRIEPIQHEVPINILLAEDNLVNQKMMLMMLKKLGYSQVLLATNGEVCVELVDHEIAAGRGEMLVVLMDVSMEPMDGLEATRIIRQRTNATPNQSIQVAASAITSPKDTISILSSSSTRDQRASSSTSLLFPPYIIAQTAATSVEMSHQCISAGMNHFLQKPIRLDALVVALRMAYQALKLKQRQHLETTSSAAMDE